MSRRKWLFAIAAAMLLGAGGVDAQAQDKKFRVGISLPEAQNPFYVAMGRSIVDAFKARNIEPILLSANADVNEQVNNINDLVAAKVDAILMSPLDQEGPAAAVERAHKAGIPIFMIARRLHDKYRSTWKAFVGIDLELCGAMKGEWLVKNAKPGKVAMLLGPAGALVTVEQERGFRGQVEKAGFKVVWAQNSTQTRENGLKLAEDALVSNRDLVAIYAGNDDLALGAAQAVKAAGLEGKVAVLGLNGSPPALAAVHKGDMAMTVLLNPVEWGRLGANSLADFLQHNKLPSKDFVALEPKLVTNANAYDLIPPPLRERLGVKPKT
jgi:ribose transport system substrate-binding protein